MIPSVDAPGFLGCGRTLRNEAGTRHQSVAGWTLALLLVGLLSTALWPGTTAAKGDDVCPEANDNYQEACFLGTASDALGFISRPDDIDGYRFEVYDYNATVRIELADMPLPYRIHLTDWNKNVIARGENVVQTQVPAPGSYVVFVDSRFGEFSDSAPYRIKYSVTYRNQPPPTRIYARDVRGGHADTFADSGSAVHADEYGEYSMVGGRITLRMKVGGTLDDPVSTSFYISPDPPDPGPIVEDFTMTIDALMTGTEDAGYQLLFRRVDDDNYYQVDVTLMDQQVALSKFMDGERLDVTDWVDAPSVLTNGANRTIVRAVGNKISVNINGTDVLEATDDSFKRGLIGYGAVTWGDPPTIYLDNILVTTPTRR